MKKVNLISSDFPFFVKDGKFTGTIKFTDDGTIIANGRFCGIQESTVGWNPPVPIQISVNGHLEYEILECVTPEQKAFINHLFA